MRTINYSAFRANLTKYLNQVNESHQPFLVTRQGGKPAVLMSLEDFHSYEETSHLMASSENARRLNESIAEVKAGKLKKRGLIDE